MSLKDTVTSLFKGGDPTTGIGILCDHVESNHKILKDLHKTIKEENGESINGRLKSLTFSVSEIKKFLIRPTKDGKVLNERKRGWNSLDFYKKAKLILMVMAFLAAGGYAWVTGSIKGIHNSLTNPTTIEQSE